MEADPEAASQELLRLKAAGVKRRKPWPPSHRGTGSREERPTGCGFHHLLARRTETFEYIRHSLNKSTLNQKSHRRCHENDPPTLGNRPPSPLLYPPSVIPASHPVIPAKAGTHGPDHPLLTNPYIVSNIHSVRWELPAPDPDPGIPTGHPSFFLLSNRLRSQHPWNPARPAPSTTPAPSPSSPDLGHARLTKRPQIVSGTASRETNETQYSYETLRHSTSGVPLNTQIVSGGTTPPRPK